MDGPDMRRGDGMAAARHHTAWNSSGNDTNTELLRWGAVDGGEEGTIWDLGGRMSFSPSSSRCWKLRLAAELLTLAMGPRARPTKTAGPYKYVVRIRLVRGICRREKLTQARSRRRWLGFEIPAGVVWGWGCLAVHDSDSKRKKLELFFFSLGTRLRLLVMCWLACAALFVQGLMALNAAAAAAASRETTSL